MNSNQYSSLPHTQNGGGVGQQRYGTNQQQNGNQNSRNYKKKHYNNKRNYNTNPNNPNQNSPQFNNSYGYNNHTDFGLSSLPHTNSHNNYNNNRYYHQFNKFNDNAPDLNSFGNNVPVPKLAEKKRKGRGGGANNNYRGTGKFNDNGRLNKSLNKDDSLDNSFNELTTGMPTSLSLDNIGGLNFKNAITPSKMSNSHSAHNNSPSTKLTKADTILEQEVSETTNSHFSNIDSGVDSNSYSSMPNTDMHKQSYTPLTSELLSSIECDEEEPSSTKTSSSSQSSSSPDSPNTVNGYETAISQMTSEAEMSFGYDSMTAAVNIENTITNFNIESEFTSEIETYLNKKTESDAINTYEIEDTPEELPTENVEEDTTASILSDSSDNASLKEEAMVAPIPNAEETLLVEEKDKSTTEKVAEDVVEETSEAPSAEVEETSEIPSAVVTPTSPVPEIVVSLVADIDDEESEEETPLANSIPNLMSKENISKELETYEEVLSLEKIKCAEMEVNDLVNKIVLDVITSAIKVETTQETEVKAVNEESEVNIDLVPNYMSLEQEISLVEEKEAAEAKETDDKEISFIDNDQSVVYGRADTSAEIIECAEEDNAAVVDSTKEILTKTNTILSASPLRVSNSSGTIAKEPPVDCFSCTIS